jgi:transposase
MPEKYSLETKVEVVSYVLEENQSKKAAARKFKIDRNLVRAWVYTYEIHGIEGLRSKNYFYSGFFKANVVRYMLENEVSANKTAARFNISCSGTVRQWRRIYLEQGEDALKKGIEKEPVSVSKTWKMEKEERKELLAEIRRLQMENDYLKKLNALVQEKEKLVKGKK